MVGGWEEGREREAGGRGVGGGRGGEWWCVGCGCGCGCVCVGVWVVCGRGERGRGEEGWVGGVVWGGVGCIEMRHRHHDHFVRLWNGLKRITSLMNHQVQHVMDDCACNAQED